MAAKDGVRTRCYRRPGNLTLIVGDFRPHEMDAPVLRNDDDIGIRPGDADVCLHRRQIATVRKGVDPRRGARLVMLDLLIQRVGAHRRAAGPPLVRPVSLRQDGGIGEDRHPRPVSQLPDDWFACLGNVGPRTHDRHAGSLQIGARGEKRFAAPIHAMIAGHRNHVKPGPAQRSRPLWPRKHRMARLRQTVAAFRKAGFQLAKGDVSLTQHVAGRNEAFIVIFTIHGQIAGGQQNLRHASPPPQTCPRLPLFKARLASFYASAFNSPDG